MLIISKYIAQHELKPLLKYFLIKDLISGANKVLKGLSQEIQSLEIDKNLKRVIQDIENGDFEEIDV